MLDPQTYKRPEDLAAGQRHLVASFGRGLPWELGDHGRPNKRLYYQVLVGELVLEPAYNALLKKFAEDTPERPGSKPHAPLAVVVCDKNGIPQEDSVSISSFGWGLPIALSGDLSGLGRWPQEEKRLIEALSTIVFRRDRDGAVLPLDDGRLTELFEWLLRALSLDRAFVRPPSFALRVYQHLFIRQPPEPQLLNSFFLGDLARARVLLESGQAPPLLQRYVGAIVPTERRDVLHDSKALRDLLAPARTPLARWPGPKRASLVTLQQAAVNAACNSEAGTIVAVNGPPGTGKTTLLRDIVAAVITRRAEVLVGFDDPASAFTPSGLSFTSGGARIDLRRVTPKLHGFELVVASSNNKAVENVSAELPGLRAIADDLPELRYFSSIATALRGEECWGLAAAVLGKSSNVFEFQQTFWKDQNLGLNTYLSVAAGAPRQVPDASGSMRIPTVVQRENPPSGRAEALARWRAAQKRFNFMLEKSRATQAALQRIHELESDVVARRDQLQFISERQREAAQSLPGLVRAVASADSAASKAGGVLDAARHAMSEVVARSPGWLARLFRTASAKVWAEQNHKATEAVEKAAKAARTAALERDEVSERLAKVRTLQAELSTLHDSESRALAETETRLRTVRSSLRAPTGAQLAELPHDKKHLSSAWFDGSAQRERDDVFIASMALHKAFVDAAAEPLRHNIAALMRHLWTGVPGARSEHIRDLWASFSVLVPLVSTTFASVERMFGALGPGSIGWLLLDESGQATPQSAVGAIMRAQHAVVVGDPMQVEPVVALPHSLTRGVCAQFGVDAVGFGAPSASAQSLADRASPLVGTFETRVGARAVGVPLLVHRRCSDPMFGISNAVAYQNLMVSAKAPRASPIGAALGPSQWIHVEGAAAGHWCAEEGEELIKLLAALAESDQFDPDLYIVTPFRAVAQSARDLVVRSNALRGLSSDLREFAWNRIGTVHTVQGREAEAVIFLLGAPEPRQQAARLWAGSTPNLLNVAVSRAKERLYVIGNRAAWRNAGCFRLLDERLS